MIDDMAPYRVVKC